MRLISWIRETAIVAAGAFLVFLAVHYVPSLAGSSLSKRNIHLDDRVSVGLLPSCSGSCLVAALDLRDNYPRDYLYFLQKLRAECRRAEVNFVVIVPEQRQIDQIASGMSLPVQNVLHRSFRNLNLVGTPTLILLDSGGRVTGLWQGMLPRLERVVVLTRFNSRSHTIATLKDPLPSVKPGVQFAPTTALIHEITIEQLQELMLSRRVVDVRDRQKFAAAHQPLAINVPADELSVRARIEIPAKAKLLVDCSRIPVSQCRLSYATLERAGFNDIIVLDIGAQGDACGVRRLRR